MIFKSLKYAQLYSTNSNQHSIVSNMHSSIWNIQINIYNLHMYTCTPTMYQILQTLNTNRCSRHAPIQPQHEAPQMLLQTLETLKVHSLTN